MFFVIIQYWSSMVSSHLRLFLGQKRRSDMHAITTTYLHPLFLTDFWSLTRIGSWRKWCRTAKDVKKVRKSVQQNAVLSCSVACVGVTLPSLSAGQIIFWPFAEPCLPTVLSTYIVKFQGERGKKGYQNSMCEDWIIMNRKKWKWYQLWSTIFVAPSS